MRYRKLIASSAFLSMMIRTDRTVMSTEVGWDRRHNTTKCCSGCKIWLCQVLASSDISYKRHVKKYKRQVSCYRFGCIFSIGAHSMYIAAIYTNLVGTSQCFHLCVVARRRSRRASLAAVKSGYWRWASYYFHLTGVSRLTCVAAHVPWLLQTAAAFRAAPRRRVPSIKTIKAKLLLEAMSSSFLLTWSRYTGPTCPILLSICTGILETWRKIHFELVKITSLFSN